MAMTGTITASNTAVAAGEATSFTIVLTNPDNGVLVNRIEGTILPLGAAVRLSNGWPRLPLSLAGQGQTHTFGFTAVGHKAEPNVVQSPFTFTARFSVVCDDGQRIELDSPSVMVGPSGDGVRGAARYDGPLTQNAPALAGVVA